MVVAIYSLPAHNSIQRNSRSRCQCQAQAPESSAALLFRRAGQVFPFPDKAAHPRGRTGLYAASHNAGKCIARVFPVPAPACHRTAYAAPRCARLSFRRARRPRQRPVRLSPPVRGVVLNLDVRHHFAGDLAEAAQAVGEVRKPSSFHVGNVAGGVPAVFQTSAVLSGRPR